MWTQDDSRWRVGASPATTLALHLSEGGIQNQHKPRADQCGNRFAPPTVRCRGFPVATHCEPRRLSLNRNGHSRSYHRESGCSSMSSQDRDGTYDTISTVQLSFPILAVQFPIQSPFFPDINIETRFDNANIDSILQSKKCDLSSLQTGTV